MPTPSEAMEKQRILRERIEAKAREVIAKYPALKGARVSWSQAFFAAVIEAPTCLKEKPWVYVTAITEQEL